jgi:hypothetical protein
VGEEVLIPSETTYIDVCGTLLIRLKHRGHTRFVFPWRIGRPTANGTCQWVSNWREFFATSRQP